MTTQQRWAFGLVISSALSMVGIAFAGLRAARADYAAHKEANAADIATTKQAILDMRERLERIERMIDARLPRRSADE